MKLALALLLGAFLLMTISFYVGKYYGYKDCLNDLNKNISGSRAQEIEWIPSDRYLNSNFVGNTLNPAPKKPQERP